MDISDLEFVLTVCEEGGITRASEKLFIAQPALSRRIKSIETKVGFPLFDRSVTPIALTTAGKEYVNMAIKVIGIHNDFLHKLNDINELKTGELRVGIPKSRAMYFLPIILPSFYTSYPGIKLRIFENTSSDLEKMLLRGKLDIIFFSGPCDSPELESKEIIKEGLYLATPPGYFSHKIDADLESVLHELRCKEHNFILLNPGQRLRQKADAVIQRYEIKVGNLLETSMAETALSLCVKGLGLAFTTDIVKPIMPIDQVPDYYKISDEFSSSAIIAYRKGSYLSHAAKAFIKHVKSQLAFCRK